jgi:hypothetical protein
LSRPTSARPILGLSTLENVDDRVARVEIEQLAAKNAVPTSPVKRE